MGQSVGEVAIVGKQEQPFAVGVEPTDRKEPFIARNQPHNCWAAMRIVRGGNNPDRLVHDDVVVRIARLPQLDQRSINGDDVGVWIDASPQFAYNAAIHRDAARHDHVFSWP